jgi:hypothetical protein
MIEGFREYKACERLIHCHARFQRFGIHAHVYGNLNTLSKVLQIQSDVLLVHPRA